MAKQNKPAIRFKEFTDAWEQRKLGELLKTITTGKSVNSDDGAVAVGDIGILKTSCVSYDRFNPYESKPVVKDELQSVKCAVEKDSVIVSRMNTPERVGACGYVSTDFPNLFLPDRLWKLKFQDNVDTYFVYMMLVSSVYKEKITSMASGTSGSMYNIPKETFLNLQLVVPVQTSEQRKIGQVLRQLNDLITLHQRKYDKLQVLKKAMLEKMFPKNGSNVPEIRFKGFTDAWEQRKLSEMCGTFEYGLNAAAKEFDGKNKYIRITDIDDASREFLLSDLSSPDICLDGMSKYLLSSGDIVFARTGASVGKTYIYRENDGIVYFAGFLIRAKVNKDNDAEFVFQSTLSPSYEKYIRITSQRSGQPGVNAQEYSEYDLFVPSKEEQQRIGQFLRGIDNLITLHQRELEKLQNIKKSMLEKMFV